MDELTVTNEWITETAVLMGGMWEKNVVAHTFCKSERIGVAM